MIFGKDLERFLNFVLPAGGCVIELGGFTEPAPGQRGFFVITQVLVSLAALE
jgi:hypothetical protein